MSEIKTKTELPKKSESQAVSTTLKSTGRKLFNYYINKNISDINQEKVFFYRANRWRFSSKGYSTANKYNRIKYPLLFAAGTIIVVDFIINYDLPAHH